VIPTSKLNDFFISYPGPDIAYAQTLCDTLWPVGRTYLAPQPLLPGEDWPNRLPMVIRDTWRVMQNPETSSAITSLTCENTDS
jgi:hypothetical protein